MTLFFVTLRFSLVFFTLMSRFCDTQASGIGATASDHNRKRAMNKKPLVTVQFKKFYTPKKRYTLSHLLMVCARQFIWMQKSVKINTILSQNLIF